ncbi:unnamed protein product [Lactuca saligna]|nr:unnamed protein product [Lactuca saligna]
MKRKSKVDPGVEGLIQNTPRKSYRPQFMCYGPWPDALMIRRRMGLKLPDSDFHATRQSVHNLPRLTFSLSEFRALRVEIELIVISMNYILGAFKPACNISITFADAKTRKQAPLKKENGQTILVPLFQSQENIAGKICLEPSQGKKVEHNGIKIELLGQIEMYFDRGNFYDFTSLVRELDVPGEVYEKKTYPFEFSTVEMMYETYNGANVRLRYVLKVTINRGYAGSIVEYQDFVVHNYTPAPDINNSIKMEVGIEDCLHIEFEYNKSKYDLKDVIIGKIYFLLVRIKLKNMDLEIRRRESTGSGANTHVETETLAKFELMDGAPVRGESIPIRLFLSPYELTPTHRNINNKFSVKYYLNLVLVDEEDRR